MTERPHSVWPSLKEKRWNTHTDSPSVNSVCVCERERERGDERASLGQKGNAQRAVFVFVQLVFVPPAGLLISSRCSLRLT